MPQKRPRAPSTNDFIVSDNDNGNDGRASPPAATHKKARSTTGRKDAKGGGKDGKGGKDARAGGGESGEGGEGVPGGGGRDGKGEEFWEISEKRRVNISAYGGKRMVNIREYYEKDGEVLPGKKGISLTLPQFNALVALLPHIESVLAEKGESITRPDYSGESSTGADKEIAAAEGKEGEILADAGGGGKRNFEETSDEE